MYPSKSETYYDRYSWPGYVADFSGKIIPLLWLVLFTGCVIQEDNKQEKGPEIKSWTQKEKDSLVRELRRIQTDLLANVSHLNKTQWFFKSDTNAWSISEVVEHLEVHDELFRREITVITQYPEMINLSHLATDPDEELMTYSQVTDQNVAKSPWYLEPLGRWSSKKDAINAFNRVRNQMIRFIEETDKDFRRYYSPSGKGKADFRDLHQLMLISIAHSDRHLSQIQKIKRHADFPVVK